MQIWVQITISKFGDTHWFRDISDQCYNLLDTGPTRAPLGLKYILRFEPQAAIPPGSIFGFGSGLMLIPDTWVVSIWG